LFHSVSCTVFETANTYICTKLLASTAVTVVTVAKYDALVRAYFADSAVDEGSMEDLTANHLQSLKRRNNRVVALALGRLPSIGIMSQRCACEIHIIQTLDNQRQLIANDTTVDTGTSTVNDSPENEHSVW